MQIKLFQVGLDDLSALEALNVFLRGNRVLQVTQEYVSAGGYWSFCVQYLEGNLPSGGNRLTKRQKIDYREVLDAVTFGRFDALRQRRKAMAAAVAVPVYAVFTNEELAKIAAYEQPTMADLVKIDGIGKNKIEQYGAKLLGEEKV